MRNSTRSTKTITALIMASLLIMASMASAGGPPIPNALWADGALYRTILTPAMLPNHGPKDGLYVIPGLPGQRGVAESKPGDKDYNGGRWQVYVLDVVDAGAIAGELMSWEEVEDHIDSGALAFAAMGPSFVCPLIK